MYMTNATDDVRKLIEKLEGENDKNKMQFLLYVFNNVNTNMINNKNTIYPNIDEDKDLIVFNFDVIGLNDNYGNGLVNYLAGEYNLCFNTNIAYTEHGVLMNLNYTDNTKLLIALFEKLSFIDKIDIISELIIRFDNETYFTNLSTKLTLLAQENGYDIAKCIQDFKKEYRN